MDPPGRASVVDRAFAVLGAFAADRDELTLEQLSARSNLPRSTAHRLAKQLERQGALVPTRRGWRLGLRLFELGQLVPSQQGLRELALPHMNDLYEATHHTIQLAVLDGWEVVYVEVIAGHDRVKSPSRRGGRMPAHCTAVGKVLLAFGDAEPPPPLEQRTRWTLTDPGALTKELHRVRRAAIAFDHEEALEGLCCVAAPVLSGGRAVAAMSVSLPAGRGEVPSRFEPAVRMAARALERSVWGRRPI